MNSHHTQRADECRIYDVHRWFYYNNATRDCYFALNVDSGLPQHLERLPGFSVRFAKPHYRLDQGSKRIDFFTVY
ncbi:hypothetical protein EG68_06264 [Paragonimus skrjabini miyazakii]|uniref:Uncharacterized protein n=1 Tax=Paragonimus skrjabini miyazakii TaxID=59628 RepID=A0A8S9YPU1_9TREM|nr:hypothetical protein EG68_06264 [Paragonimus skrjabini miyazakii]